MATITNTGSAWIAQALIGDETHWQAPYTLWVELGCGDTPEDVTDTDLQQGIDEFGYAVSKWIEAGTVLKCHFEVGVSSATLFKEIGIWNYPYEHLILRHVLGRDISLVMTDWFHVTIGIGFEGV